MWISIGSRMKKLAGVRHDSPPPLGQEKNRGEKEEAWEDRGFQKHCDPLWVYQQQNEHTQETTAHPWAFWIPSNSSLMTTVCSCGSTDCLKMNDCVLTSQLVQERYEPPENWREAFPKGMCWWETNVHRVNRKDPASCRTAPRVASAHVGTGVGTATDTMTSSEAVQWWAKFCWGVRSVGLQFDQNYSG